MQSVYSVVIAGITGVLFGAAAMYVVDAGKESTAPAAYRDDQLAGLMERMNQTETLLREIRIDISANSHAQRKLTVAYAEEQRGADTNTTEAMIACPDREELAAPDMAVEDAVVQNIITRLYDPDYTRSTTLAEVMQSEEMLELSGQSRERVLAAMVGMLNLGEIDAATFLPGQSE